jgi:DNA/RNA-binding protein KIN17
VGEIKMLDSSAVLKLDQEHLETVIPAIHGEILVVNGKYRGQVGVLVGLEEEIFAAYTPNPKPLL